MTDLRYPIGPYRERDRLTEPEIRTAIESIAATPSLLRDAVAGFSQAQLDTPYRPEGWTVRQVVHHLPDSHLNAYVRFKLALTEHEPVIKPYDEAAWAELRDSRDTPIEISLSMLDALHSRWVLLLRAMTTQDFDRRLKHPERGTLRLDQMLASYEWHGAHHVAHVTSLRDRMGWTKASADWGPDAEDRRRGTGDRRQGIWDRRQGTGDRRGGTGDR